MKLKINNKYEDVDVWSFLKCSILVDLLLLAIIYGLFFAVGIIIGVLAI